MATFSRDYADPQQTEHILLTDTLTGDAGVLRYATFSAMNLYSVQATVAVAGTSSGAGAEAIVKVTSGTSVSTIGTITLGSSAAGTTFNLAASTTPGGFSLNQGDVISVTQGTDASVVAVIAVEVGFNASSVFTL